MQKFIPRSHVRIFCNECIQYTPLDPKLMFFAFYSVWAHLLTFRNCMKLGAERGELVQLMQKFVLWSHIGIFATKAPNQPHWTINSCFGALHSVWVHLGSFHNCMKLDAKQGEMVQLMQRFVPRSHVWIFRNEGTQPAPLDPKLMFFALYSVWVRLGSFRNCMKLHAKQCELVQLMHNLVPCSHVGIFCNERTQSTPLDPKLMFWCVA